MDLPQRRVLLLPSWYPTSDTPLHGTFMREQALLMSDEFDIRVLMSAARNLSKLGSFVSLLKKLTFSYQPVHYVDNCLKMPPEGVFFRYDSDPFLSEEKRFAKMIKRYAEAMERLVETGWKPDLIHAHSAIPAGMIAHSLAAIFRVPFIITEHSPLIMQSYSDFVRKRLKMAFSGANRVVAVSHYLKRMILTNDIDCNPVIIGNAIDGERFSIRLKERSDGSFRILCVAQPVFIKDLPTFFRAMRRLIELGHEDIRGCIIVPDLGGGLDVGVVQGQAEDAGVSEVMEFVGNVDREDIPQYFQACDVFVSSSISETFGLSICEAMACGKPVVTTSSGGVSDILTKENGIRVPIGDYVELAAAVVRIKTGEFTYDPDAIRESVLSRFGYSKFKVRLREQYQSVIGEET